MDCESGLVKSPLAKVALPAAPDRRLRNEAAGFAVMRDRRGHAGDDPVGGTAGCLGHRASQERAAPLRFRSRSRPRNTSRFLFYMRSGSEPVPLSHPW
ncbi:hypothetical protein AOLI_G00056670 [Acnodon oligacanthus]